MGLYDTVAGAADHLAGSTDEAVGRQFDGEKGGGFADGDTYTYGEWRTEDGTNGGSVPAFKVGRIVERVTNPEKFREGTEEREDFVGDTPDFDSGRIYNRVVNDDNDPNRDNPDPTNPDNWAPWMQWLAANLEKVAAFVVLLVTLYLLKPLLEIVENATEA
jgi:hypothetical protein